MIIKLVSTRSDDNLEIIKFGDVLTINGVVLDFGPLPDGATLPAQAIGCQWINDAVERVDGNLVVTVTMPVGPGAGQKSWYPDDIINPPDGRVALPTDLDPRPSQEVME
ncbi:hypothetical protein EXW72_08210 [Pseudomonas sp. BCA14]|nr:hypothetical protein EXW70_04280 [Pseudomonas sp. JMN1]TFF16350.1 hypothetical protein EXW71_04760 [Pseudomonas sp. BCA17]TFF32147.1 hypothetical protein EXW72_08210 [Pseudomonas sp. BCA14]TFF33219.1 hypothetical protein EXW73_04010 [Pseudomonas sp. BCA13]